MEVDADSETADFLRQIISDLFDQLGNRDKYTSLQSVKKWCQDKEKLFSNEERSDDISGQPNISIPTSYLSQYSRNTSVQSTQCTHKDFSGHYLSDVKEEPGILRATHEQSQRTQKAKPKKRSVQLLDVDVKCENESFQDASLALSPYSENNENIEPVSDDEDTKPLIHFLKKIRGKTLKQTAAQRILKKSTDRQRKIHTCKICGQVFHHGTPFRKHLLSYSRAEVCCRYCRETFHNHALVLHHKCKAFEKRGRKGTTRHCHYCNAVFTNKKKLDRHLKLEHSHANVDLQFFCRYCGQGFERRIGLFAHFKQHAGDNLVCIKCGEFLSDKQAYAEHMAEHEQHANFVCEKCGATFMQKKRYVLHLEAHCKYTCEQCSEDFGNSRDLRMHQRQVHHILCSKSSENQFVCSLCHKVFKRHSVLALHMRIHTGEKPVECSICQMYFRTNKALSKHRQTQSHLTRAGEKPLSKNHLCNICGNTYFRKQSLQRHMHYHSGALPYSCPHCDYRGRESTNFHRHMASHFSQRQFVCETCGAAFQDKKTLQEHNIFKHTTAKNFVCEECSMGFKTAGLLRRHSKTHSDERPWKCSRCDMGFIRLHNLRRHVNTVHKGDADLPPLKKVKLVDAPEGREYVKDAYSSAQPNANKAQHRTRAAHRHRKSLSSDMSSSQPAANTPASQARSDLIDLPGSSVVRQLSSSPTSVPSSPHASVATTESSSIMAERVLLTPQILSQIIAGNFDIMRQLYPSAVQESRDTLNTLQTLSTATLPQPAPTSHAPNPSSTASLPVQPVFVIAQSLPEDSDQTDNLPFLA